MDHFIHKGLIENRLIKSSQSKGFAKWQSNNPRTGVDPEFFYAYLFNVTNPDEIMEGAKPILQEVGPFIYTVNECKFDTAFSEDKNTVDCKKFQSFIPHGNNQAHTTFVTVADISYAAVRSKVDPHDEWYSSLAFDLLSSAATSSPFIKVSVQEYIFGYNSHFLSWLNHTLPTLKQKTWFELQHNMTNVDEGRDFLKNLTDTFYTGNDNLSKILQYKRWHGIENLEIWNGTDANALYGTDGRQFQIGLSEDNLTIFIDTLYRHSNFWYNTTYNIKGIDMRIYWVDPRSGYNHAMGGYQYDLYGPHGVNNMTGPEKKNSRRTRSCFYFTSLFLSERSLLS